MDHMIWLDWIPTIFRGLENLELSCFRFDGVIELKKLIKNPIFEYSVNSFVPTCSLMMAPKLLNIDIQIVHLEAEN